jgi:hypothetical protein
MPSLYHLEKSKRHWFEAGRPSRQSMTSFDYKVVLSNELIQHNRVDFLEDHILALIGLNCIFPDNMPHINTVATLSHNF